jgi:formamidopyrimidine-DNA glycosylase
MPEIPDIEVFSSNLKKMLAGKEITAVKIINGKRLADTASALNKALKDKKVKDIYRSGKEMRFLFSDDVLLGLHLMLTGDIFLFDNKNEHHSTIVEIHFKDGSGLALTDRMGNANIRLNPVDKDGVDALDEKLNFEYLKKLFQKKAQVKNILLNQNLIRGIGNSYSDEILWETKISPFSIANAIPDEKIKELVNNIKKILKEEIVRINRTHPGLIQGEIKEFLKIHSPKKERSPDGAIIKTEKRGMLKTYYTDEQVLYK